MTTTPPLLDPAGFGAGVLAAAAAELIGPLSPAATPRPLTLRATPPPGPAGQAEAAVGGTTRHALVLCTVLSDVDTVADAARVAKLVPRSRFAAAVAAISTAGQPIP